MVLLAAAVVAVALIPIVIAYTQLGYDGVATTEPTATTPDAAAVDALERAAFDVATDEQARQGWAANETVGRSVALEFDDRAAAIETGDLQRGRIHQVQRNDSAAAEWASEHCPAGANRQFGNCAAHRGVVLQERADETHVLAIAVDVTTVTESSEYRGTYVLDAALGDRRRYQ